MAYHEVFPLYLFKGGVMKNKVIGKMEKNRLHEDLMTIVFLRKSLDRPCGTYEQIIVSFLKTDYGAESRGPSTLLQV